jgi:hypothetical protein
MHDIDDEKTPAREQRPLSRREFMESAVAVAGASVLLSAVPTAFSRGAAAALAEQPRRRQPVVGFHMDRPYLDPTGTAQPYHPPAGTRSGQAMAELSDEEFLSRHPYF